VSNLLIYPFDSMNLTDDEFLKCRDTLNFYTEEDIFHYKGEFDISASSILIFNETNNSLIRCDYTNVAELKRIIKLHQL
jgi:hypothetical protein